MTLMENSELFHLDFAYLLALRNTIDEVLAKATPEVQQGFTLEKEE